MPRTHEVKKDELWWLQDLAAVESWMHHCAWRQLLSATLYKVYCRRHSVHWLSPSTRVALAFEMFAVTEKGIKKRVSHSRFLYWATELAWCTWHFFLCSRFIQDCLYTWKADYSLSNYFRLVKMSISLLNSISPNQPLTVVFNGASSDPNESYTIASRQILLFNLKGCRKGAYLQSSCE